MTAVAGPSVVELSFTWAEADVVANDCWGLRAQTLRYLSQNLGLVERVLAVRDADALLLVARALPPLGLRHGSGRRVVMLRTTAECVVDRIDRVVRASQGFDDPSGFYSRLAELASRIRDGLDDRPPYAS